MSRFRQQVAEIVGHPKWNSQNYCFSFPTNSVTFSHRFGPAPNPPRVVLDSLGVLFSRNDQVESAFAADLFSKDATQPTSLLIAIEVSSDHDRSLKEAAAVVSEYDQEQLTIDLTLIERDGTDQSAYFFADATPFYTRKVSRN